MEALRALVVCMAGGCYGGRNTILICVISSVFGELVCASCARRKTRKGAGTRGAGFTYDRSCMGPP